MYGLRCLNLCNFEQKKNFKKEEKMQFLLEKNLIFAAIKFREFREFTHFHNFRENQISRFFQKLARFAKINSREN